MNAASSVCEMFEIALRNIANGAWNVGRKPEAYMTAQEYATLALHSAGVSAAPVQATKGTEA